MKKYDVIQGTPEWRALRIGIVTASKAERILNDGTKRSREKIDAYANLIVSERILKREIVKFKGNYYTDRGMELEPDAVRFYEAKFSLSCKHVGFITNDAGTIGCSPDAIASDIKGLEIKCPEADTHIGYLCDGTVPEDYICQVQTSLFVTGFPAWDFMSYYPELPPFIVTVYPDIEFHAKLEKDLDSFESLVREKMSKMGYTK